MDLKEFDFADLEIEEIGIWPWPLRAAMIGLVGILVMVGMYHLIVKDVIQMLTQKKQEQRLLRQEFSNKFQKVSSIDGYRKQMIEVKEQFYTVLRQLPSSNQLPDLIEELSQEAGAHGLEYDAIRPGEEMKKSFYVELPLELSMVGTYHGFGTFLNEVAKLSRIVTLHDFKILKPEEGVTSSFLAKGSETSTLLTMTIEARTYWYLREGGF